MGKTDQPKDRRSITVPNNVWQYVKLEAHISDRSEASVVRQCIQNSLVSPLHGAPFEFQSLAKKILPLVLDVNNELMNLKRFHSLPEDTKQKLQHCIDGLNILETFLDSPTPDAPE
jgi:hypothetical protein